MVKAFPKLKDGKTARSSSASQDYDELAVKTGKYSLDKIESYFTLCELTLTPRSNPLLAVEDLYLAKQGSMTSGEFHSHILKIVKRCQGRGESHQRCHFHGYE